MFTNLCISLYVIIKVNEGEEGNGEKKGRKEWRGRGKSEAREGGKRERKKRENERIKREKCEEGGRERGRETLAVPPKPRMEHATAGDPTLHIYANPDPHSDPTFNTGLLLWQKPAPPMPQLLGSSWEARIPLERFQQEGAGSVQRQKIRRETNMPHACSALRPAPPRHSRGQPSTPASQLQGSITTRRPLSLWIRGAILVQTLLFLENPSVLGSPRKACQLFVCQINHLPFQMPSLESV